MGCSGPGLCSAVAVLAALCLLVPSRSEETYTVVGPGWCVDKRGFRFDSVVFYFPENTLENCANFCSKRDKCLGFTMIQPLPNGDCPYPGCGDCDLAFEDGTSDASLYSDGDYFEYDIFDGRGDICGTTGLPFPWSGPWRCYRRGSATPACDVTPSPTSSLSCDGLRKRECKQQPDDVCQWGKYLGNGLKEDRKRCHAVDATPTAAGDPCASLNRRECRSAPDCVLFFTDRRVTCQTAP